MFERIKKAADDVRSSGDFALQAGIYKSQVGLKFRLVWIRSETIGNLWTQAMRNSASFVALFVVVIETAVSKPLWTTFIDNNYIYSTSEINAQPQYLATYQNTHSPYYIYNVHTNAGGIPSYNFYYETPIYDYRIPLSPLSPIYPVLIPSQPELPPGSLLPPTSTQEPSEENDYDGIEKLDMKVDPNIETKKPENNETDSVVVDAI